MWCAMQHIQTRRWDAILKLKPKKTVNTSKLFTCRPNHFKKFIFLSWIHNECYTFIVMTNRMSEIVAARQSRPWIQPNFLFQMSEYSSKQRKVLGVLHGFTDDVSSWLFLFWVALHYNVRMRKKKQTKYYFHLILQVIRRRKMERKQPNHDQVATESIDHQFVQKEDDSFVPSI